MSGAMFRRQATVFVSREMSPQARSAALATAARRGLDELIASGQASPTYQRVVDGVVGAREETVKPDGVIVYRFSYMAEVALFALAFLRQRAPRRSGALQRGFFLSLDGKFVYPADRFNPRTMGEVAEVMIGNVEPYNRKADVQMVGGQRLRFNAPAEMYDDAIRAIRSRYGAAVDVKRVPRLRFPRQYVLQEGRRAGRPVESPGLAITLR